MSSTSPPALLRGATRPRIEVAPAYADTFGAEAADLMERAAKPLDQWQRDAVNLLLATRDDGRWACVEYVEVVARQNGKGAILEARVLAGFLLLGEKLIMWSAHEVKTTMEAFLRLQELLQALDPRSEEEKAADPNFILVDGKIPIKVNNSNGHEGFRRLDTRQRIRFIARSKSSGRGFTGDLNVIDETFAYTPAQHAALFPTMMARKNPQIIYTSTPPLDSFSGVILQNLRRRALAILESLKKHGHDGGDKRLAFRDWGNEGDLDNLDKIDLADRRLWAQSNPSLSTRITEELIEIAQRTLPLLEFAREVLCIWPRLQDNVGTIDSKRWNDMLDASSRRIGDVGLGVDIEPARDYAAIAMAGVREDTLEHWQIMDYRPGVDWVVPRLVELKEVLGPVAIGVGKGTYASIKTKLDDVDIKEPEDPEHPKRGELLVLTHIDMSASCGQLLDLVNQDGARHVGDKALTDAANGATIRKTTDSVAWSRKSDDVHLCPLVAVGEARYALHTRAPLLDEDYDVMDSIG